MNISNTPSPYSLTRHASIMPRTNQALAGSGGSSPSPFADQVAVGNVADAERPAEAESFVAGPADGQVFQSEGFQQLRATMKNLHSLPYITPYTPFVDLPEEKIQAESINQQLYSLSVDIVMADDRTASGISGGTFVEDVNSIGLIADNARLSSSTKDGVPGIAERARQRALSLYLQNGGPGSSSIGPDTHNVLRIALGL